MILKMKSETLQAMVVYTKLGSREDLGRPTISPIENKIEIMKKFD